MTRRSHTVRLLLRWIGPVLLLVVVSQLDDRAALWAAIKDADWPWLAGAIVLNLPVIHLKVIRWRRLLAARGFAYPLGRTYAAVLSSLFLGMVTPGRVGDAVRIQYVRCDIETPYVEGLAATMMDRFCDLYVLAGVAAFGIVHFAAVLRDDLAAMTWLAVVVALALPLLFLARGPADLFKKALERFASRWHISFGALLTSLRALVPCALTIALPLTVAAFAISYAQGWMLSRAIDVELSYLDVAALLSATSLLSLVPVSISGIGVRELFLALIFPALHFGAEQGVAFGILVFLCINVVTALIGLVAWQLSPPPVDRQADPA